jgi:hypothetical protein
MRRTKSLIIAAVAATALLAGAVTLTMASPPSGVTPSLLARGTFDSFDVKSYPQGPGMFKAEAKEPTDVVVRRHDYAAGGSTGWHAHPGPVFVTVVSGQITFYEYDDPGCTPIVVTAGHGYVDSGRGHMARNETGQPATDISVIIAPVAGAFRTELEAPSPFCGF